MCFGHYQTSSGEHVGYITATQKQGVFFKTGRAYVKTDVQSSQEDTYCVIDNKVFDELKAVAEKKSKVKISYISYISAGVKNCDGEGEIITAVSELK